MGGGFYGISVCEVGRNWVERSSAMSYIISVKLTSIDKVIALKISILLTVSTRRKLCCKYGTCIVYIVDMICTSMFDPKVSLFIWWVSVLHMVSVQIMSAPVRPGFCTPVLHYVGT